MKVEIPLTKEQEESMLMNMISSGSLFMDLTYPSYPIPVTVLDLMYREAVGMDSNLRKAIPQDIPMILNFYDNLRLIEEVIAK